MEGKHALSRTAVAVQVNSGIKHPILRSQPRIHLCTHTSAHAFALKPSYVADRTLHHVHGRVNAANEANEYVVHSIRSLECARDIHPVISIVVERLTGTSIAPSSRRRLLRFLLLLRRIEGDPRVIGKTGSKTDEETVERYPGDPSSSSPPCHDGEEAGN